MSVISKECTNVITGLVKRGGPEPEEYDVLNIIFGRLGDRIRSGEVCRTNINEELWDLLDDACSIKTLQGMVALKPHGYAGDYEIIDKIYTRYISPNQELQKWDYFFHSHPAVEAVRNRKAYFVTLISNFGFSASNTSVLSVGCGPSRDIYEFCATSNNENIDFECVDMDPDAVKHSKLVCAKYLDRMEFHCENIFRFTTTKRFGLIWAAGLFDYLDDKQFVFLLKRMYSLLAPGGELIIGNFSKSNGSKDYMEAGDWYLNYRSKNSLIRLALEANIEEKNVRVFSESLNINLFMHIQSPSESRITR